MYLNTYDFLMFFFVRSLLRGPVCLEYKYIYTFFLIQRNSLSVDDNTYDPLPRGWALCQRNITVANRVMQSSSNKLNSPVSNSVKCKQRTFYTYKLIPKMSMSLWVCHQPDIKLDGFWRVLIQRNSPSLMTIYTYIYIYILSSIDTLFWCVKTPQCG